jgi:hypothetical protein
MDFLPSCPGSVLTRGTRRDWLRQVSVLACLTAAANTDAAPWHHERSFHLCLSPEVAASDADLLQTVYHAGVRTVWLAGFFYGHFPYASELIEQARQRIESAGMTAQLVNVPLGHPGDSLGASDGQFPLTPPKHWQLGRRPDQHAYAGTSLHPPATQENTGALARWRQQGFTRCFLDDDFRLARGPGEIGGCFCDAHRRQFLLAGGYSEPRWLELLEDVRARRLTALMRAWLDFTCDELTGSFQAQQRAFGRELGIMAMYLGAEKAGIRLRDYRRSLFRAGELMFDDRSFGTVKGKTDELFSVLFHRRFAAPERAFSETTAYPANQLSAQNLAAKLAISTLGDVRQTMFMSGLTPFPRSHWDILGPAIKSQTAIHRGIAGHRPVGPFKHYWGEHQRLVGDDLPFSLWLAAGVPFEVVEDLPHAGWTFLSDFDAEALMARQPRAGAQLVCRDSVRHCPAPCVKVGENLKELFAFKHQVRTKLRDVPHIEDDEPAICAWYPSAHRVLVWNLSDAAKTLGVVKGRQRMTLTLQPLELGQTTVL